MATKNFNDRLIPLERNWYLGGDVVLMARQLLGKYLCTRLEEGLTVGKIVETEAYCGIDDKACHANNNRRTKRNEIMYAAGGVAYVYLCYGIHHLFNVVTNVQGMADAVLIRAIEPVFGLDVMMKRRGLIEPERRLTAGPGALTRALGIDMSCYGLILDQGPIWIGVGEEIAEKEIKALSRIGVQYAGEDALKPWRFTIKQNVWVSK